MFVLIFRVTWQQSVALDIIHFEKSKLLQDIRQIWWVFIAAGVAGFIGLSGVGYFIYGSLTPPDQMIQPLPCGHFLGMIPLALAVGFIYIKIRRLVPIMIVHYIMDIMTVAGVLTLSM